MFGTRKEPNFSIKKHDVVIYEGNAHKVAAAYRTKHDYLLELIEVRTGMGYSKLIGSEDVQTLREN